MCYLLPGHLDHLAQAGAGWHQSRAGVVSSVPYEREADAFAATLLMPAPWFSRACQDVAPGLAVVKHLAGLCGTSLTATAERYIDTTTQPVALIMSTGHLIDYCFLSAALQQWPGLRRPPRGSGLPLLSPTYYYNVNPEQIVRPLEVTVEMDVRG